MGGFGSGAVGGGSVREEDLEWVRSALYTPLEVRCIVLNRTVSLIHLEFEFIIVDCEQVSFKNNLACVHASRGALHSPSSSALLLSHPELSGAKVYEP